MFLRVWEVNTCLEETICAAMEYLLILMSKKNFRLEAKQKF